ncbi:MAG TPA: hypothetical protein VD833_21765 [Vicinamibacterales bacterium]|nr:hypothetical protein [Vicinamibacterales bacterium]
MRHILGDRLQRLDSTARQPGGHLRGLPANVSIEALAAGIRESRAAGYRPAGDTAPASGIYAAYHRGVCGLAKAAEGPAVLVTPM